MNYTQNEKIEQVKDTTLILYLFLLISIISNYHNGINDTDSK